MSIKLFTWNTPIKDKNTKNSIKLKHYRKVKHWGSSKNLTLIDWYIVIMPSVPCSWQKGTSENTSVDSWNSKLAFTSKGRSTRSNFCVQLFFSSLIQTTIGHVNVNFWQVSSSFCVLDENRTCYNLIQLDQKNCQSLIFPRLILLNIFTKWPPQLGLAAVK